MSYENYRTIPGATAGADLSAHQYKMVKVDSTGRYILNDTLGEPVDGVLMNIPESADDAASVADRGIARVLSGAAVAAGSRVMSDANGKGIVATTGKFFRGRALTAATAADQIISVNIGFTGYEP